MWHHRYIWVGLVLIAALFSLGVVMAQDEALLPLAAHGSYVAGIRSIDFVDPARADRPVTISLWYPGIMPADKLDKVPILQKSNTGFPNLPPEMSGAPYPVVLYSHGYTSGRDTLSAVLEPLVTHGFVVVTVQHANDTSARTLIDRPLDIRFVLDQLETLNASDDLIGLMRLDQVGLIGTSDGGYTALTMTGARIDESFISQWGTGERDPLDVTDPRNVYSDWDWTSFKSYYEDQMLPVADGFLQPMTDARVGAIVSFLPCWTSLFGEQGLAMATVPTLLIAAGQDISCPYEKDAAFAYQHLGSADNFLLTLVGAQHDVPRDQDLLATTHYVNAFFSYELLGMREVEMYFTADFVGQFDNLAWGVYAGQ